MASSIVIQSYSSEKIALDGTTRFGAMFVMPKSIGTYPEKIPECSNTLIITRMENYPLLEKYTSKYRARFQQICAIEPHLFAIGCSPCYVLIPDVDVSSLVKNPQYIYKFYFDEECMDYAPMPMPYLKKMV